MRSGLSRTLRMTPRTSFVARIAIFSFLALATMSFNRPAPQGQDPTSRSDMPEARLRKLHLVRPDLIPYPIAYEVYC